MTQAIRRAASTILKSDQIINSWPDRAIDELADIRGRVGWKGYTKKDLRNVGPLALGAKHIDSQNRLDLSDPTHLSREKYLESPEIFVFQGDVLIVQRGTIGRVVFIDRDIGEATINPSMVLLRSKRVIPAYLYYQLISSRGQNQILLDTSSTGVPMITQRQIGAFTIPLPSSEEQRAISNALTDSDALIASLDALIAKKRDLKQAAMQQLLTGKTRLPGFEAEWSEKSIGELCRVDPDTLGATTPATFSFNYISLEDVEHGRLNGFTEMAFRDAPSRARRHIQPGDLLISTVRPNLKSHLLFKNMVGEWVCSTGFSVLRPHQSRSISRFLYQHFFERTVNDQIEKLIAGSNYPAISSRDVRSLKLIVPCVKEQEAIADALADMDAELASLEAKRDKAIAIKQGMMQELLTGRVRLV